MEKNTVLRLGWGYSMTINNFYVIERETKAQAVIRQIGSRTVESGSYLAGYEVPDLNEKNINFKTHRVLKTPTGYKGSCGLSSTYPLEIVKDGDRFYFNHCD